MIAARVGNRPGLSFRVKVVGGEAVRTATVDDADPRANVHDVRVDRFERAAVFLTGREMARLFVLEPGPPDAEYAFGPFYVRGAFRIVEKVNNGRAASERWRAFA